MALDFDATQTTDSGSLRTASRGDASMCTKRLEVEANASRNKECYE